jgi:preprotein translocase subunit SecA
MDRMGFKEGDVLEAGMLNKSVERAQKKVEENNFGIRKRLLEYDDVMNSQRNVVYTRRRHALMGERIGLDVVNTLYDVSGTIAEQNEALDYEVLKMDIFRTLASDFPYSKEDYKNMKTEKLTDAIFNEALELFKRHVEKMAQTANPIIRQVYESKGAQYENILIPVTDGKRMYNISCNLKEAYETNSKSITKAFQKSIILHTIDEAWKEHLREMDELRSSVQNASYENKDPLLIYKLEAYNLFKSMVEDMNKKTASILMRGQIPVREDVHVREAAPERRTDLSRYRTRKDDVSQSRRSSGEGGEVYPQGQRPPVGPQPKVPMEPVRVEKQTGRNEPCPCGSGKKYKNCHGRGL